MENKIELNFNALLLLKSAAKWATFLAVIGLLISVSLLVAAVFMAAVISTELVNEGGISHQNGILSAVLAIIAIFYFLPVYFLFRFAIHVKSGIKYNNNEMITNAFGFLKSHFKTIGILTIMALLLNILGFIFFLYGQKSLEF
jgi:hypothetical protein